MWWSRDEPAVVCIACGAEVSRADAREYDKYGDRWHREGKTFEFFCKPCDRERCHQPRRGLESLLIDCGAGERPREVFLERYVALAEEHHDTENRHGER